MATKKIGLSRELLFHPGVTIAEMLEERHMSQMELATLTGVSSAYVCNVISGKKDISAKFALALEYALGVSKSFWLNLQANYDAELLEVIEAETITEEERSAREKLEEVVKFLRNNDRIPLHQKTDDSILALRKILMISNIANLKKLADGASADISNPYVNGAWIRIKQIENEREMATTT